MAVIEGTLMEHEFLPFPKDGLSLFHSDMAPKRCFRSCILWVEIQSITILSIGSSSCAATQSITCKFTHALAALARTAVSSTCLCIFHQPPPPLGHEHQPLPTVPTVTLFRIDLTASASSFNATWLRASATALSLSFWYLMLNVNPASDSTQWCWVASKLGVVKM